MADEIPVKNAVGQRVMRIIIRVFVIIIALLLVLVVVVNIPAVQTFVAGRVIKSIRKKTRTELSLGSVKIAIPNTVKLNELFLLDKNADTLLYVHSLDVDIDLFRLLKNTVSIKSLSIENVVAHIQRQDSAGKFNFQFLVDEFAPSSEQKPKAKKGKPWLINVDDISLKNIHATFFDAYGGTDLQLNLGDFYATLKNLDLSKPKFDINEILLKNTSVNIKLSPGISNIKVQEAVESISDTLSNPIKNEDISSIFLAMNISADKLTIENTNLYLDNISKHEHTDEVDYQHLHIKNINTSIHNISLNPEGYRADILNMSLTESSGISVKKLSANAQLTNLEAELKNLEIETDKSRVSGDISLGYLSLNSFLDDMWNSKAELNIENSRVNADEIFLFAPFLTENVYAGNFKHSEVYISAKASGKINDINIRNMEISVLDKTILKTKGSFTGLPDISKLHIDATIDNFETNLSDVYKFVDPAVFAGIKLPQSFNLTGTIKGKLASLNTDFQLKSSYGNITAEAFYANQNKRQPDTFNIRFTANNILAGVILSDTMIGKFNFSGHASGSGITENKLSGSATIDIREAEYNAYTYHDIHLEGQMSGKVITAVASSADTNLNFGLSGRADLSGAMQEYAALLNLSNANFKSLNFTSKDLSLTTTLSAGLYYAGINNSEANLEFANTTLTGIKRSIPIKTIDISGVSTKDSLRVDLNSDIADGTISGNINPENLRNILLSAYKKYFGIADTNQQQPGKHLAFAVDMHIPQEILTELDTGLDTLIINKLTGTYNSDNNELIAELRLPKVVYSGAHFDSLNLALKGKDEDLTIDFQSGKIVYNTLQIENLSASEKISKGKISSEITILDSLGKTRYLFANEIALKDDVFKLSFKPNGLILNGESWDVMEGNLFERRQNELSAQKFLFSKGNQSIGFIVDKSQRQLVLTDFEMQDLINIIEFQGIKDPVKGKIIGKVDFPLPGNIGFVNANLNVDSLYVMDSLTGNLVFNVKTTNDKIDVDISLVNEQNKVSIAGDVNQLSDIPQLNLDATIDINDLRRLEQYSFGLLSEMKGKIDGKISLRGIAKKPDINGFIGFEKATFKINSLNFFARIEDEKILLSNRGIHFDNFVIEDTLNKKLRVDGDLLANNFTDLGFDLHVATKDFQPMNSTSSDNALFYGKLSLAADMWLKGDIKSPDIQADITIDSATNLTYALPGSELKLVTSEGIVNFLEPGQKYDTAYVVNANTSLADSIMSRISGLNLAVNLKVDPDAKFTVDVDPKSGDYLTLNGNADLKINADRSGKQTITGSYEVSSGLYQLSFYNLVKKTFIISPGSTVTWSGNPKDADLNISANYAVTAPSTSLMADESVSMSETENSMFKQRLPYNVKLNILGFLTQPEISFNITLPDKYLTTNPLIATKLTQLNSPDYTDALNKQVFALLVTGGFIADNSASTGSSPSGIASTAARNSVNGILAGQMNNMTSKYVRNFDLNFGLTTFDDGTQGSGDPTTELDVQVSKKLFNERVTIEAQSSFDVSGNKNTSPTTSDHNSGEVAVTYKLTQSGVYRLKAFSQTAYDLFDGDILSSGIALIFTKNIDSLKKKKKADAVKKKKENGNGREGGQKERRKQDPDAK